MLETNAHRELSIDLEALYPELTEEQRKEAAYYLSRYLDLIQRIFERAYGLTEQNEADSL